MELFFDPPYLHVLQENRTSFYGKPAHWIRGTRFDPGRPAGHQELTRVFRSCHYIWPRFESRDQPAKAAPHRAIPSRPPLSGGRRLRGRADGPEPRRRSLTGWIERGAIGRRIIHQPGMFFLSARRPAARGDGPQGRYHRRVVSGRLLEL